MSHASPRKSVVIDSMINLFFERISHMDPSLPISDVGDDRCLLLIVSCDLRASDLAPYFRPCNTATFTAKRDIYCDGGGVGEAIFIKLIRLLTPCNKPIATAASLHQCVLDYQLRSLSVLPCQIVLQFRPTKPLHPSHPPENSGTTDQPVHPSLAHKNENLTGCLADRTLPFEHLTSATRGPAV